MARFKRHTFPAGLTSLGNFNLKLKANDKNEKYISAPTTKQKKEERE